MDSAFPTTTAAMLPSLYLGQSPAVHGYVEWRHYEQSLGAMINVLPWRLDSDHGQRESLARRGVEPTTILQRGTFFKELKEKGVAGHLVQPDELQGSTFNSFIVPTEDASTVYYGNLRKGLDRVTAALATPGEERRLIILYAMKYDHICHILGPGSAGAREALQQTLNEIDDWYLGVAGQHPGTVLTLTADHGQIHVPLTQWISLPEKAPLLGKYMRKNANGGLVPMAGSARDRFAYLAPGTYN
jgi:predicted AlkP superfamily pyrophosphatase or phosphodiesterase